MPGMGARAALSFALLVVAEAAGPAALPPAPPLFLPSATGFFLPSYISPSFCFLPNLVSSNLDGALQAPLLLRDSACKRLCCCLWRA